MKVQPPQYVPGLDLLRFLAACAVMLFHLAFWSWAYPAGQVSQASNGVAAAQDWPQIMSFGWIGVQLFFVISGFVIATSAAHSDALKFFISRFVRLAPGVWVCATITLLAWLLIEVGSPAALLRAFINSVAFVPFPTWIDSVYWTLGVEIAFYGLVLLLIVYDRLRWIKPMMCVIGLASTALWASYFIAAAHPDSTMFHLIESIQRSRIAQLSLLHHGVFFALGVLLYLQLMSPRAGNQFGWLGVFLVGGCLQICAESALKVAKTGLEQSPLVPCLIWLGSMAIFYWLVRINTRVQHLPPWSLRTLRRLGLMTYPLYLLHNVAGGALMGALVGWKFSPDAALLLAIVLITALSWWVSVTPEPWLQKMVKTSLQRASSRWQRARALAS